MLFVDLNPGLILHLMRFLQKKEIKKITSKNKNLYYIQLDSSKMIWIKNENKRQSLRLIQKIRFFQNFQHTIKLIIQKNMIHDIDFILHLTSEKELNHLIIDMSYQDDNNLDLLSRISNMSQLKEFRICLQDTNFDDQLIRKIEFISQLNELSSLGLFLSDNLVSENGIGLLFNIVTNLSNLTQLTLQLSGNILTKLNLNKYYYKISNLKYLQEFKFELNCTDIDDTEVIQISRMIQQFSELKYLTLGLTDNDIHDESIQHLCETIQNLMNLASLKLFLNYNYISDVGADILYETILNCKMLDELTLILDNNDISIKKQNKLLSFQQKFYIQV